MSVMEVRGVRVRSLTSEKYDQNIYFREGDGVVVLPRAEAALKFTPDEARIFAEQIIYLANKAEAKQLIKEKENAARK